jgi:hypothetical protein
MFERTSKRRGTSRSPAAGLATGTIFKREPESAVDREKRERPERREKEEPAEPEAQAEPKPEPSQYPPTQPRRRS